MLVTLKLLNAALEATPHTHTTGLIILLSSKKNYINRPYEICEDIFTMTVMIARVLLFFFICFIPDTI